MKSIRIAVLLAAIGASFSAFAQETIDYSIEILAGQLPTTGGEVLYALLASTDWWTITLEPFTVRLTVPPGIEPQGSRCYGFMSDFTYDPASRVLTWTDSFGDLALRSCPVVFKVAPTLMPGATFTLDATITPSTTDPNLANNTATHTAVIIPSSDLEIKSQADVGTLRPGERITYTSTVTNRGPQDAHDVMFLDYLSRLVNVVSFEQTSGPPAVVQASPYDAGAGCYMPRCGLYLEAHIPFLPNGSTATFRLVVNAKTSFEAGNISNRAIVWSTSVDYVHQNDSADAFALAGPHADLGITSTRLPEAPAQTHIPIRFAVSNDGPENVSEVTVSSVLHDAEGHYDLIEGVKILSVTSSQGTCTEPYLSQPVGSPNPPPMWAFDCALGPLAPGAKATITVAVERASLRGRFVLAASVSPGQNDPNPVNNHTHLPLSTLRRRAVGR